MADENEYESLPRCWKFGPEYARKLKRRQGRLGDIWHLDEVFVKNHRLLRVRSFKAWSAATAT